MLLQGSKADSLLTQNNAEEHARVRKEFQVFFNADNVAKVVHRLAGASPVPCLLSAVLRESFATGSGSSGRQRASVVQLQEAAPSSVGSAFDSGLCLYASRSTFKQTKRRFGKSSRSQDAEEVERACDALRAEASQEADGSVVVDVVDMATGVVDRVVRKARFCQKQQMCRA